MSRKKPNLKTQIKDLRGNTFPMSFPTKSDIEKVKNDKKVKDAKDVLVDDLPKETIQNVILNALGYYEPTDRKEVFLINNIANWAMGEPEKDGTFGELKDKFYNFLVDSVLNYATIYQSETKKEDGKDQEKTGIYSAWVIAQVYEELGVTE